MNDNAKKMCALVLKPLAKTMLALAVCGLVLACGKKESAEQTSQSIVSVNGEDITFLQLNHELQRARIKPEQQTQVEKQIVSKLLDRQMLVQASIKEKLDRNPQVLQAIENAKMQILAQSYLENKTASIAKPTESELANYYNNHADIFANRKVYVMDQLVFTESPSLSNELEALSDTAKTIEEVAGWLNAKQITYAQAKEAHSSETLPPEFLSKISKMAIGEIIFFKTNQKIMVSRMADIQSKAISEKDSKPIIQRILAGQKRKELAEAEMKRLRSAAKITYINKKFEPTDHDSNLKESTSETTSQQNSTAEPSAAAPVQKPTGNDKAADHIEKGISGL